MKKRQTMNKNLKLIWVFFLTGLVIFLSNEAMAFTLEPRVGYGDYKAKNVREDSQFIQTGINMYFYESGNLDIFAGAEQNELKGEFTVIGKCCVKTTATIMGTTLGVHIKPATTSRFKPYLSLGGVAGRVEYNVQSQTASIPTLFRTHDYRFFTTYRAGIGVNMGLSDRLSLGLNASYTGPLFKYLEADAGIKLWEGLTQTVYSVSLLYSF